VATFCFEQGFFNACVNRAYYAMLQIVIALLLKDSILLNERIDHAKIIGIFAQKYCHETKEFSSFKPYLNEVQLLRNRTDIKFA
jgi:uncharacterized protein (UPF0332 family)